MVSLFRIFLLGLFFLSIQQLLASPERIVSLSPVTTEAISFLGMQTKLVGASTYCNYPEFVKMLPKVGDLTLNYEMIVSLNPDIVVGVGHSSLTQHKLNQLKIPVKLLNSPESLIDIQEMITSLSEALNTGNFQLKSISSVPSNTPKLRTMVVLQTNPIIVAGNTSYIAEMVILAGGKLCSTSSQLKYPHVSKEMVLMADPEVIICGYPNLKKQLFLDPLFRQTSAGKSDRIINTINPDLILRPGPRVIEGIDALREVLR